MLVGESILANRPCLVRKWVDCGDARRMTLPEWKYVSTSGRQSRRPESTARVAVGPHRRAHEEDELHLEENIEFPRAYGGLSIAATYNTHIELVSTDSTHS